MPRKKTIHEYPTRDKVKLVAGWLHEKKARDIVALDVTGLSPICEAMIIASAGGVRQAKALAEHVLAMCGERGMGYLGMEGQRHGQWILIDLNDVLVNIFQEDLRALYNLEGLWSEGAAIPLSLPVETEMGGQ